MRAPEKLTTASDTCAHLPPKEAEGNTRAPEKLTAVSETCRGVESPAHPLMTLTDAHAPEKLTTASDTSAHFQSRKAGGITPNSRERESVYILNELSETGNPTHDMVAADVQMLASSESAGLVSAPGQITANPGPSIAGLVSAPGQTAANLGSPPAGLASAPGQIAANLGQTSDAKMPSNPALTQSFAQRAAAELQARYSVSAVLQSLNSKKPNGSGAENFSQAGDGCLTREHDSRQNVFCASNNTTATDGTKKSPRSDATTSTVLFPSNNTAIGTGESPLSNNIIYSGTADLPGSDPTAAASSPNPDITAPAKTFPISDPTAAVVSRRFSEFCALDDAIQDYYHRHHRHLVPNLPPFPPKGRVWQNQQSADFIRVRRDQLQAYLRKLLCLPHATECPAVVRFLWHPEA